MAFVASSFAFTHRLSSEPMVSVFRGSPVMHARRARPAGMSMNLDTIQAKIQDEMKKAQEATAKFGKGSKEAALAWDAVEELEAEASHMKSKQGTQDPLDKYCEETPEADEVSFKNL